jgi:hypothetical protein
MERLNLTRIIGTLKSQAVLLSLQPFFNLFCGRATFFALVFTGAGIALAFRGKLTADFVGMITAIQALILAHSWKEDIHDQQMARLEREGHGGQQ